MDKQVQVELYLHKAQTCAIKSENSGILRLATKIRMTIIVFRMVQTIILILYCSICKKNDDINDSTDDDNNTSKK